MSIFAQHGHNQGSVIIKGLKDDILSGIILSPRYLKPESLKQYVDDIRNQFTPVPRIIFDPQFYVTMLPNPNTKTLARYGHIEGPVGFNGMSNPRAIADHVERCLGVQFDFKPDKLISPSWKFESFSASGSTAHFISRQLLAESLQRCSAQDHSPLLISIVIGEAALANRDDMDDFLTDITAMGIDGVYLIVELEDDKIPAFFHSSERLANLMYLVYSLSEGGCEVIVGYADLLGPLLQSVGASASASGEHDTTLKRFDLDNFSADRVSFAARRKPKYLSIPLFSVLVKDEDLALIHAAGMIQSVITGTRYDKVFLGSWCSPLQQGDNLSD